MLYNAVSHTDRVCRPFSVGAGKAMVNGLIAQCVIAKSILRKSL